MNLNKLLLKKVAVFNENAKVCDVLFTVKANLGYYESYDYVYVVSDFDELLGYIKFKDLFNIDEKDILKNHVKKVPHISYKLTIERMSQFAISHDLKEIPIVEHKKFIGVIPSEKIFHLVNKSLNKNILTNVGVEHGSLSNDDFFENVRGRLPWLTLGLLGAFIMAMITNSFEEVLKNHLIIAAFVPTIVYLSGASGIQTQILFLRDLSLIEHIDIKKYIARQLISSLLITTILITIMYLLIIVIWDQKYIALVISLSAYVSLIFINFTSIFVVLVMRYFKFDPAFGSGPIGTVISDTLSVVIYFTFVFIML